MRPLADPHYSFTIPSIHDDITLDCRIYHSDVLDASWTSSDTPSLSQQWRKRGIVMAHPYAPLGGSYDDRVVGIVVDEFLQAGYIVGTFNFRGAHGSKHKGHTSWSGKPETDDYTSFAACFIHYMSLIRPFPTPDAIFAPEQAAAHPSAQPLGDLLPDQTPLVILGGYSYGSLILKHLPPIPTILQQFSGPLTGSSADEVLLRARKLADQSNLEWINSARVHEREKRRTRHEHKSPLIVGGEETTPDLRRSSREVKRSLDIPHTLDLGHRLRSLSHRGRRHETSTSSLEQTKVTLLTPEVRYLLISPLTPPISTLAAPAFGSKLWNRSRSTDDESIGKLASLAIYGDQDQFSSAKKTRDWCDHLTTEYGPSFSGIEISGAGHFWVEPGVEKQLRDVLREWTAEGCHEAVVTDVAHKVVVSS